MIRQTPWLTWLLLTKRPENFDLIFSDEPEGWPLNAWAGVTAENQEQADIRIPILAETPAPKRFVSYEPALVAIELWKWLTPKVCGCRGNADCECFPGLPLIDWLICGGESDPRRGRAARLMHPDWARSTRDQCQAAGVPFFFKQWGDWAPLPCIDSGRKASDICLIDEAGRDLTDLNGLQNGDEFRMCRIGKKSAGRLLAGREWNERPAAYRPKVATA